MLGHVVLLFAGFAFERTATLGAKPSETAAALVTGPMARTFAGGYVECLGFIVLLFAGMLPPGGQISAAVDTARLLRGEGETAAVRPPTATPVGPSEPEPVESGRDDCYADQLLRHQPPTNRTGHALGGSQ